MKDTIWTLNRLGLLQQNITNRVILTQFWSLEAQDQDRPGQGLAKVVFIGCRQPPSHNVFSQWREQGLVCLLRKTLIPIQGFVLMALSKPNHFSKQLPWELGLQYMNFGGQI